jgi:UDP-glucose 4-epimerase
MRIFITGASGFIGQHVVRQLEQDGHTLLLLSRSQQSKNKLDGTAIVQGDLGHMGKWQTSIAEFAPDSIFHLAWEGIPDYGPSMSMRNLQYGVNLAEFAASIGCKKFIAIGSCWEYGAQSGMLSEDSPVHATNSFTAAKHASHIIGREIARTNGMQFIWTRLFYVYGPGQKENSLIPYLIRCAKEGMQPELKTPGAQNDFIYVGDVASALALLAARSVEHEVFNIGSGNLTSVQTIASVIGEELHMPFVSSYMLGR